MTDQTKTKALITQPIGTIRSEKGSFYLQVDEAYRPALLGLEGFSHLLLLWHFDEFDQEEMRHTLQYPQPYHGALEMMGVFATRGPVRPNPIAVSVCQFFNVDQESGRIDLAYIDANNGSPLLDIKPYTPSLDRVEKPAVPAWCSDWPKSLEESASFDWNSIFTFES